MRETIIILGAGVMQGPAIRIAKELGFFTVAVDGNAAAPHAASADQFEQIDLKDKGGIEAFARSLGAGGSGCCLGRLGIMTAGTDFSATVAWVAEKLGLPGIPYEVALNASDKARMRACFQKAGLPSPEFTVITKEDLEQFSPRRAQPPKGGLPLSGTVDSSCAGTNRIYPSTSLNGVHLEFPLVIKPVDNMGGRGCRRVNDQTEFREAAEEALRFSRSGRAIVEAFMEGPEFSVDAIVYHGEITICGLADRHIFFPPWFIEMGHTMPTALPPEQQEALLETFRAGVRALSLAGEGAANNVGAAKGDIKLTPQGPMIGEIAARLSGGYMSGWTYPYSSGVEPVRAAILLAMGREPGNLAPLKNWTSAERAFISIPGTVKAIIGVEAARSQPHVQDLFLRIAPGDEVDFPRDNVSKCGNIISAAPNRAVAISAAETAARSILIRLETVVDTPFPNAFSLTPELKAALALLPDPVIAATPPEDKSSLEAGTAVDAIQLIPFPALTESGLTDYMGRTVAESLDAIRQLSGLSLPEIPTEKLKSTDNIGSFLNANFLGRSFWAALVRGGYQGAVYYIDSLK